MKDTAFALKAAQASRFQVGRYLGNIMTLSELCLTNNVFQAFPSKMSHLDTALSHSCTEMNTLCKKGLRTSSFLKSILHRPVIAHKRFCFHTLAHNTCSLSSKSFTSSAFISTRYLQYQPCHSPWFIQNIKLYLQALTRQQRLRILLLIQ